MLHILQRRTQGDKGMDNIKRVVVSEVELLVALSVIPILQNRSPSKGALGKVGCLCGGVEKDGRL